MVTFLTGPVLSIILIVLAGIALRYALWYRAGEEANLGAQLGDLRDRTTHLSQEAEQLRREKESLEATLQDREGNYSNLRGEYEQLRREYDVLNDASRQLELDSDRQRQSVEQIEETITTLRLTQDETERALNHEANRNEALYTELDAANQTVAHLRDELDAAGELRLQLEASRENCRDMQQSLERSQETIARLEVDARFANALREKQSALQAAIQEGSDRVQRMAIERDDLAARLESAHEQALLLRDQMNDHQERIARLEQERDEVLGQLGDERNQRQAAEAATARAQDVITKLESDLESMNQLQVAHQFLQNTVADTQSELTALREQRDSLTTSLSNSQHHVAELDQFVATLKKEIVQSQEAARQTVIEKEEVLARFKRERHELHSSIAALRQEKEAVVKSLLDEKELTVRALLEEKAATVKSLLQEKETAVTALVAEKESVIAALAKEKESVASQLENESASRQIIELALERIRAELDELRVSKETIDAELQREQLSHRLVEKKLRDEKNHYAAILEQEHLERLEIESSLQSDLDELHERIHAAQQAKSNIEAELQEKADYYARVEASLRIESEQLRRGSQELRQRHEARLSEIEREGREKTALRKGASELQNRRERVLSELAKERQSHASVEAALRERAERLRHEKERTLVELSEERDSRFQIEEALRLHAETVEKLRAESMSMEELLARQSAVQSSLSQHAQRLRVFRGDLGLSQNTDVVNSSIVATASANVVDESHENPNVLAFPSLPLADGERFDRKLGLIHDQAPRDRDELQRISGVDEGLETRLNEIGVYTYEQIMNWDATNVKAFSELLGLQDRIEREKWVAQAARLHDDHDERRAAA